MIQLVKDQPVQNKPDCPATISGKGLIPETIRQAGTQAVESYLCFFARMKKASTTTVARSAVNGLLRWCMSQQVPLIDLRPGHVEAFLREEAGRCSHSSISVYVGVRRRFFAHLERDRIVERNPFDGLATPKPDRRLDEMKQFLLDLDRIGPSCDYYHPGLIVCYPLVFDGMNPNDIARDTKVPLKEVELYVGRLRENGIWTADNKIRVDTDFRDDDTHAAIEIVLQIMCAAGHVVRTTEAS